MSQKHSYGELKQRLKDLEEKLAVRMQLEATIRRSEETARALLNATSDSAILIDPAGMIIAINEIAVNRLGKSKSKVVGTDLFDMFPPDIAKKRKALAAKVIRSGEPVHFEDQIEGVVFNNTFYPLFDIRGKVEKLAIYSRDITDQKRAAEHLQRAEQMKLVGDWAVGLAHEIKNPLAGIKVSIEVLLADLNLCAEDKAIVFKAVDEIKRIEILLKNLLNFAKPPQPQCMDININELLDKTISFSLKHPLLSSNPAVKIKILKDFDENIPMLTADPVQLQQVFLNLLFNAIEAMPEGGVLGIQSIYDKSANAMTIKISDTGKGIDEGILEEIYKPFFTTKTKGSGLGLAITKRFVEQHGGFIFVHSEPGTLTTFNVHLPLIALCDQDVDRISNISYFN